MNSPVNFNDPTGHMCMDPDANRGSAGCEGSALQKTKIGDKMISGNGKTPGLGNCGGFGQKKCPKSGTPGKGGFKGSSESSEPIDNVKFPLSEWKACAELIVTATCGYGSSSLKLKFSNLDITTSPESLSIGDISISRSDDLDYSFEAYSSFHGNNKLSSGFGISFNSLNSIKVSGEMSVDLHEENASGNFTVGISHEYRPGNQVVMQTVGGALVALFLINPRLGSETIQRIPNRAY